MLPPRPSELCSAHLQHGFDSVPCQHVSDSVVDRFVGIVTYQPINRQLASAVESDQLRQKGLHVTFALHTTAEDATLLQRPHLQGHLNTRSSAAHEARGAARGKYL